ncbi:uncharacterized protein LOC128172129 [Crassostrea angulata]|uniref:uncharacterized protein LOC128172129 n=1 Tax=Magallana angulata TaxID=2784310 RepID=UPI00148AA2E1|nr:uncharacterized protein LOC117684695 isoform X1 [Crassostrea gigas]XP_052693859.1 uncharacterized protein LOC128172129 [Crassostrea angulata]
MTKLSYIALTYACVLTLGICKFLPDVQYDSEFFNKLQLETDLQREESFSMSLNNLNQFLTDLQRKSRAIIRSVGPGMLDNVDILTRILKAKYFSEALKELLSDSKSPQGKRKRWIV